MRMWIVCLLCVCAWRGPLPVVHCHAFETLSLSAEVEGNWQLAEHLMVCHAGQHEHGDMFGWHLHFVLPPAPHHGQAPHELPLDRSALSELIVHDVHDSRIDVQASSDSIDTLVDFVSPYNQPVFSSPVPRLIPLAPPRSRPSRVSPRIYYCVAQC